MRFSQIDCPDGAVYIDNCTIMNIGVCSVRFRLPDNLSLKGKRQIVKSLTTRVRNKFNVSVAETEDHDLWQVVTIGIVYISNDKRHANEVISKVIDFINESRPDLELLGYGIELLAISDVGADEAISGVY